MNYTSPTQNIQMFKIIYNSVNISPPEIIEDSKETLTKTNTEKNNVWL